MIDGVQAFAKCAQCGNVCWTVTADTPQAVQCRCGAVRIVDTTVTGPTDPAFQPLTLDDLLTAEVG